MTERLGRAGVPTSQQDGAMLLELMALARSEGPDKFVAAIKSRLSAGLQHPEIVALLYIDEAHELSSVTSSYKHQM